MGTLGQIDGQARDAKQPDRYLVAGCTPWARRVFDEDLSKLPGGWAYVESPEALAWATGTTGGHTYANPEYHQYRLAFFLHWRWRVPKKVLETTTCIGFHLGSFYRYRGGTPLQHQILDRNENAVLTVYRMVEEMDAGPVYDMWPEIPLHGSAEAIYSLAMEWAAAFIRKTVWALERGESLPEPIPATLGPLLPRRTPAESRLPEVPQSRPLDGVHDFIRMLDAEGYPHAFLDHGPYRLTFRRAVLYDGRVECDCTITVREEGS